MYYIYCSSCCFLYVKFWISVLYFIFLFFIVSSYSSTVSLYLFYWNYIFYVLITIYSFLFFISSFIYNHSYLISADIYYKLATCNFNFLVGFPSTGNKFRSRSEDDETVLRSYINFYFRDLFYIITGFICPSKKLALFYNWPSLLFILNFVLSNLSPL